MSDAENLDGSVPDKSDTVLLLIDVVNAFEFPEAPQLLVHARPMAEALQKLIQRCRKAGVAVVYVNDNFGRWTSSRDQLLEHCLAKDAAGCEIVEKLKPRPDDYFVIKPKHSGFFNTTLDLVLRHLQAKRLILAGVASDICVLFTANDAYMRDYELFIPADCSAAEKQENHQRVLELAARVLKADTRPSTELNLEAFNQGASTD